MKLRQESFGFVGHGGARKGAGRKPRGPRAGVPHVTRPEWNVRHPPHVTWRVERLRDSLRSRRAFRVIREALIAAGARLSTRIVHFSVQSNHIHLICEVDDAESLARALKSLGVRIARGLNRLWNRTGRLIADRYHARELRTPREVKHALHYVLHNARHHGFRFRGPDPCSSGAWFDGWDAAVNGRDEIGAPELPCARTWLLRSGWRRHGPIPRAP